MSIEARVKIRSELLDLNSLRSVRSLARKLCSKDEGIQKIDALILNAGLGGWTTISYPKAVLAILTDLIHAVTWPTFKIAEIGGITKPQLPEPVVTAEEEKTEDPREPTLGTIFTANVFGHYLFTHELAPLLHSAGTLEHAARLIWLSSLEAYDWTFHPQTDFQGIKTEYSYESSKRLIDTLVLTSHLPSTAPWTSAFLSQPEKATNKAGEKKGSADEGTAAKQARNFVTHPGVCSTSILPLPSFLVPIIIGVFYFARWLGSIWHTVYPYKGATAPVWLALASEETLTSFEKPHGNDITQAEHDHGLSPERGPVLRRVGKWGSATDSEGNERVERTEVAGWGWDGRPETSSVTRLRGRMRGAKDLTKADREKFEELGKECWKEMERMRVDWEERLDAAGL